ncbi:peptide transporter PTR2-A [Trichodelitschia bisporula]|uniref:Peptide transporter PTR2-A n=1 Tax=Trichodelitschia bisporula TaxID=703511 RepID=A0A6G1I2E7_9PEZI|nr:peptide transporter PTR2-A [Trichodelitschia bisporula]
MEASLRERPSDIAGYSLNGTTIAETEELDSDEPTERERRVLRRVPDRLPWSAFLVALVELCERFAYYGLSGPFQNYISNKKDDPSGNPGAIGLDQSGATALTNFFQFWCYVTPILGAVVADQFLGKYKTIALFSIFYIVGLIVLFITSLPFAIDKGISLPGLVCAMFLIGLGTGGIKSNVSPLIAEQYTETKPRVRILPTGEKVIVDPTLTIQRIYMIFYMCINIGSLSAIATTTLELKVGFWCAYLLPLIMFIVGFFVLVAGKKKYVVRAPKGSILLHSCKALWIGISSNGLDAAKPSWQARLGERTHDTPWDDAFVDELRRALIACKVFMFYPIYWVVYNQMLNNFVSQAGTMQLHGIPNDIMQNIDPITVIIFIPICDRVLYPSLRKAGIAFKPITRITWGFFMASIAMAYAAWVQRRIYHSPPCFYAPLKCIEGKLPNGTFEHQHVHVALQAPAYFFIALSEIFASITGLEYAYTKAPPSMKSLIMSMFLLTNAFGAALGAALAPMAHDPRLVFLYSGLGVASAVAGCAFWLLYRKYNATEEAMNEMDGGKSVRLHNLAPKLPLTYRVSELDLDRMAKEVGSPGASTTVLSRAK